MLKNRDLRLLYIILIYTIVYLLPEEFKFYNCQKR